MTNKARIIAVANQKGGVAKTTTAINLAASLAMANQRVLLVDMDPQANLTSGIGMKGQAAPAGTIYEALTRDAIAPRAAVADSPVDHVALIPADRHLTGAEIELVAFDRREFRLRRLLDGLRADFDFIFIDTPPSLGLLTLNALVAADAILIPLNCEYFALEGIADLLSTVDRVRDALNPSLDLEGVLLTMYDERTNLGQQVSANIREYFGDRVYTTVIPRNIKLGEAPSHGLPVILYDARSRGAEAYVALAHEFLARTRSRHPSSPAATATASLAAPETTKTASADPAPDASAPADETGESDATITAAPSPPAAAGDAGQTRDDSRERRREPAPAHAAASSTPASPASGTPDPD